MACSERGNSRVRSGMDSSEKHISRLSKPWLDDPPTCETGAWNGQRCDNM